MKDLKSIFQRLLYPPVWLTVLLSVISGAAIIAVFVMGRETSPISYIAYVMAFYTLTAVTMHCIRVFPKACRSAKQKIYSNPYGHRYFTDAAFKTEVLLYGSLGINLLYVLINLISGIYYQTAWFGILSGYYTILAVMRFLLVRFVNQNGIGKNLIREYRRARLCGIILMTVNLTLSGAVLMILYQDKGYEYNGILIYIMAMYTFYVTSRSIIDIIRYRKYNSPVMSAAKMITFSAALVSMLSLETAMLSQFGADISPKARQILVAATGAGVSVIVVAMSVYMIASATRAIKRHRINNS